MTDLAIPTPDIIDSAVPLAAGHPVFALRRQRAKVVAATQASFEAMFAAEVRGITVNERLLVALHVCRLSRSDSLAAVLRARLVEARANAVLVDAVDRQRTAEIASSRLGTMLGFAGKLINKPVEGDRAAIDALVAVGLTPPAIVALSQLIAFLSYQIRVVAGLKAMAAEAEAA